MRNRGGETVVCRGAVSIVLLVIMILAICAPAIVLWGPWSGEAAEVTGEPTQPPAGQPAQAATDTVAGSTEATTAMDEPAPLREEQPSQDAAVEEPAEEQPPEDAAVEEPPEEQPSQDAAVEEPAEEQPPEDAAVEEPPEEQPSQDAATETPPEEPIAPGGQPMQARTVTLTEADLPPLPVEGASMHFLSGNRIRLVYTLVGITVYCGASAGKVWIEGIPSWCLDLSVFQDCIGSYVIESEGKLWLIAIPPWLDLTRYDEELTEMPTVLSLVTGDGTVTVTYLR